VASLNLDNSCACAFGHSFAERDFTMDSLRSDPRYTALVRKIGFPQ
jgi:hypothetical protein